MKQIIFLILLFLGQTIHSQSDIKNFQGKWTLNKQSFVTWDNGSGIIDSTQINKRITLEIHSSDSVIWNYFETKTIGKILDENEDYAGPETGFITEKGTGTIIKLENNDSFELNVNVERNNSFDLIRKMNKKFIILIDYNYLILENKKEKIKLKMHNKG